MGQRLLILSASIGAGHNMAAAVLETSLRQRPDVDTVRTLDVLESTTELYRSLYDDGYFAMVEAVPWLVGWGYDANDPPFKLGNSISLWDKINTTSTVKTIKRFRPDLIVCTHFLPTRLVSLMLTRGSLDARLAVVTTDYDFQGLWLSSPFNHFFVAREETKAHMVNIGVPPDRLTVSGIPVRSILGEPLDVAEVLGRYRLQPGVPTLLISAGAAGGAHTETIVRQALRMRNPFQAIVVCGRNDQLKAQVEALVAGRSEAYRVLGYTTDMADLMRAATLFVGKPGGLSSSECMAAGLPMVLIKPIPGQEVRNSDFLLEEGAAVRCNYDTTIGHKIDGLIEDPGRIRRMAASARRLGRPDSAQLIVSSVLAERPAPLWISHAAQRSILASSGEGILTADLQDGRRIRTLVDARTGLSVGSITAAQLDSVRVNAALRLRGRDSFVLSRPRLTKLRRQLVHPDLLLTFRRILGDAHERLLDLRA